MNSPQFPPDALVLGSANIARLMTAVMDAAGAARGLDRARVVLIRDGRVAAIERFLAGRHYWVMPGGGVEEGETVVQAAVREAAEELGVPIRLGPLRAIIHCRLADGSMQRHWSFEADADTDDIVIAAGPEAAGPPERGTYRAIWLDLDQLEPARIWPPALASLLAANKGNWPDAVTEVCQEPLGEPWPS